MAEISQIKLPDNNTYDLKDAVARGVKMYYGTCSTAAATAAKVVTVSADQKFELKVGAVVMVKFTATNTASNVTINVNSTGAKSIYYGNGVYTSTSSTICGYANANHIYMYDGTNWVWVGHGSDSNTTYSAMSVAEGKTATATSSRVMRSDYLKQIIQYHAVPAGQGVPAGGTAGQILAKVDGTNYNTGWIDAPSGGSDMIFYKSDSVSQPTPRPIDFVYPGDIDLEFYLEANSWDSVSSDMKALLPSVDLPPYYYHYKQQKITNSSGTYLLKTARWYYTSYKEYIDFVKFPTSIWLPTGMNIRIGEMLTTTFYINTSTKFADKLKAIYSISGTRFIQGYLETYYGSNRNIVPVTGIVRSATEFEFQTNVKNTKDNTAYLVDAKYSAGTWTVTKISLGTFA